MTKPKPNIVEFPHIASLAASGTQVVGHLDTGKARTITVTCRGTTNAGASSGLRVNIYSSPTGEREDWDTIAFAYFDVDITAGSSTQETKNIDPPETGHLKFEVENLDSGQAATAIMVWVGWRRWTGV